jgi:MFS family permease
MAKKQRWLTRGVASIGLTSLFSDTGHEIVTAVLPSFITTVLGGSAATLGLIEGFSDALTGVTKVIGGPLADDPGRRGRLASGGYIVTALATGAIGLTTAVWQAGILRGAAWAARGFRSPARDSLMASLASPKTMGRAFGVERTGDNLGAVFGPLLAGALVVSLGIRPTMLLATVPGLLAAVTIFIAVREGKRLHSNAKSERKPLLAQYRRLVGTGIGFAITPAALFEAGNLATTILILRSNDILMSAGETAGSAVAVTTVLYAGHNGVAAGVSSIAGIVVDRVGPRSALVFGAAAYLAAYAGFAFGPAGWPALAGIFALAGCGIGFAETAESSLIARSLPEDLRGTGFGLLGLIQASGDLVATVVGGIIYTVVSPFACFVYAAAWMALSLSVNALGAGRSQFRARSALTSEASGTGQPGNDRDDRE